MATATEETRLGGKVASDQSEVMNENAAHNGACVDRRDRSGYTERPRQNFLRRARKSGIENTATASREGNRSGAREAIGVNQHGVDYGKLSVGSRVAQGPDHDRVCVDSVGGRSCGLHRIPDHGRRHFESPQRGWRETLTGSGRKPAAACFRPDNYRLATREPFYELEDANCQEDTGHRRPDHDRIRVNSGHHCSPSRFALSHLGNHRSGIDKRHRRFAVKASRPGAKMTDSKLDLQERAGNRFCQRAFYS